MAHLIFPNIKIDIIIVFLLAIAIIPWLETLFKSVELPGGLKLEFRDLERIGLEAKEAGLLKIEDGESGEDGYMSSDYPFVELAKTNQSLALMSLRIEIERRLRKIAEKFDIDTERSSTTTIVRSLTDKKVLSRQENATMRDLIHTLNQAAHGVDFDKRTAEWIINTGPQIVYSLDTKLNYRGGRFSHENPESPNHWIDLSFANKTWTTNFEWSQHIEKHIKLWEKEIENLSSAIVEKLQEDDNSRTKFEKTQDNWAKQLKFELDFLTSIENLPSKIGKEGQMIKSTTFMNKFRDRTFELEEILNLIE